MDKRNLDREDRTEFILGFLSRKFTIDEVVAFLEERITLDEEKMRRDAIRAKARQLVSSFKDGDGVRLIAAYDESAENEPRRMVYQVIDSCNDTKVLDKQIGNMVKNRDGSDKLILKAKARKEKLINDPDLFNFFNFEDVEKGASQ
ncbi:hypothetical protein BSK66_31750 [Paenibacillus odorifer]|uniref:hypothetical protein n=1 Tax=Paenibacillus TaxID=44249 RepID=UPI0003E1CB88|nr:MULTISPECIES: hypothetical protein [Paenibacillus]ETT46246.1 hypothetical protein C171_28362 [Paenibacillus sp. FSL H8-237]OME46668.1 hypothetical protein BSK66_31750 [Paenibacillus odorifer]